MQVGPHDGVHSNVAAHSAERWAALPSTDAARLHHTYVLTVEDRIQRFAQHMDHSGLPLSTLDWSTLDGFDDLWHWAQDHLSMFDYRPARFGAPDAPAWYPHLPGAEIPDGWPTWSGYDDLGREANEFSSGLTALFCRFAIEHWQARWGRAGNRTFIEIPRPFEHPSARFGPVRIFPEQHIAASLHDFYRHPLWHRRPPWHLLEERVLGDAPDWSEVASERADRFHEDYVGGHLRRVSAFREWLLTRGLDTTEMRFEHVAELERIWNWARSNVSFAEQVTIPRTEYRNWFPTLALNASSVAGLPRFTNTNLSAETLEFASGLAACACEVAMRSWGGDWTLGARPGDRVAANRTHLRIDRHGERPLWINPELEIERWLVSAVVAERRQLPRPRLWQATLGDSVAHAASTAVLLADTLTATQPPWVEWHVRFEDRLLPGLAPAVSTDEAADTEIAYEQPAPQVVAMTFTDSIRDDVETEDDTNTHPAELAPPMQPAPVPAGLVASEVERPYAASEPSSQAGHGIRIDPNDGAGERCWTVEVNPALAHSDSRLVERFASRLNRSRGIISASLDGPHVIAVQMNRFGANDVEAVEALVERVWDQTKATHRAPISV